MFIETSAKTGFNVKKMFVRLASALPPSGNSCSIPNHKPITRNKDLTTSTVVLKSIEISWPQTLKIHNTQSPQWIKHLELKHANNIKCNMIHNKNTPHSQLVANTWWNKAKKHFLNTFCALEWCNYNISC